MDLFALWHIALGPFLARRLFTLLCAFIVVVEVETGAAADLARPPVAEPRRWAVGVVAPGEAPSA